MRNGRNARLLRAKMGEEKEGFSGRTIAARLARKTP